MSKIEKSVDVDVPVRVAYDQWTQFEEFPRFMDGVESVKQTDDTHLHWVAKVGGVRKEISLALVDGIAVGDYVILHVGFAIQKLDAEEAEKTLALFAELGENLGAAPA